MKTLERNAVAPMPLPPESLEEAGLPVEFVAGLVLKALHHQGSAAGYDLAETLALPLSLLDDVIEPLQERRLIQVQSTRGPTRGEYVFALTSDGRKRAAEELELSRYVGPAPVPFGEFQRWIELQTIAGTRVSAAELREALDGIVLQDSMFELLGPAVNSGRSLFLYGESGNGKTLLAKHLARVFGQRYYVPYSVLVDGSVMIVYDPTHHGEAATAHAEPDGVSADVLRQIVRTFPAHDRRYAAARRPVVVTGGELTLDQLDLQWDSTGRMYQAPPQLKAAGGVLVIDDLGRQQVKIRDLLNRWGGPLEHRQDHLTLRSGRKMAVPFDCFLIFSTNVQPRELADDAFLRRIHYKIHVSAPDRAEYERIFQGCCEERAIEFDPAALDYLFGHVYGTDGITPRRCHPRDILDHLQDLADYRGESVRLDRGLLERACQSYFLSPESE